MPVYGPAGMGAVEAISAAIGQAVGPAAMDAMASAAAARAGAGLPQAAVQAGSFGGLLTEALKQVNASAIEADVAIRNLAIGREKNLHHVLIALEEASLSMQFAVQVRNKVIEAYQEVSRMQI